jgi:2-oxoglutarate ferredoxin oxidoreductase subunit beta
VTAIDIGLPGLTGVPTTDEKQTARDYKSDQEVRWCPGCGDYAILKAVQRTLPEIGADPANTVFSGRTPSSGMVRCTAFRIA